MVVRRNYANLLFACGLLWAASMSVAMGQQLIAHPGVERIPEKREIVRSLFTMQLLRWPDGSPVRVFVLPDENPTHKSFAKKWLGVFPYQLRRAWDRAVFSGTGQAPTEVADEQEMLERVANTPGAVGYISHGVEDERVRFVPER